MVVGAVQPFPLNRPDSPVNSIEPLSGEGKADRLRVVEVGYDFGEEAGVEVLEGWVGRGECVWRVRGSQDQRTVLEVIDFQQRRLCVKKFTYP